MQQVPSFFAKEDAHEDNQDKLPHHVKNDLYSFYMAAKVILPSQFVHPHPQGHTILGSRPFA